MNELVSPSGVLIPWPTSVQKAASWDVGGLGPPRTESNGARASYYNLKVTAYEMYREHPAVYACVELIVQSTALEALLYSDPKHPTVRLLESFFAECGDDGSDLNALLSEVNRDIAIAGEGFILKQRGPVPGLSLPGKPTKRSKSRAVIGLEHLLGEFTSGVPDKAGNLEYFEQRQIGDTPKKTYKTQDVLFFRIPHPSFRWRGLSPMEPLDWTLGGDMSAQQSFTSFFRNGMHGSKVFSGTNLSRTEAEFNKAWLVDEYTRPENHGKPMFLIGDIKVVDPGKDGAVMPFENGRRFAREEICAVYSVPMSKLYPDDKGSLGHARAEVDDVTFQRDTVTPYAIRNANVINSQLLKAEFSVDLRMLRLKAPLTELLRLDRMAIAETATKCGLTGNEIRTAILNLPPSDADGMDDPLYLIRGVDLGTEKLDAEPVPAAESVDGQATFDPQNEPVSKDDAASGDTLPGPAPTPLRKAPVAKPAGPARRSVPPTGRPAAKARPFPVAVVKADPEPHDSDEEDDDETAASEPVSRAKHDRVAGLVHARSVVTGDLLAGLLQRYAAQVGARTSASEPAPPAVTPIRKRQLERLLKTAQTHNLTQAVGTAADEMDAAQPAAKVIDGYAGPSLDRLLAIAARLADGSISSAQAEAWAKSEAGEAWHAYQRERVNAYAAQPSDSYLQNETAPGAHSCEQCIGLDGEIRTAEAWLSDMPGDRECGAGCRCDLVPVDGPNG